MMKRLRLLLATATGAALLLGGIGVPAASADGSDFSGGATSDAYVPLDKDITVTAVLKLKNPATATGVTGSITPPGKPERSVNFGAFSKTGDEVPVTGTFTIGKDDPAGTWKLSVMVARDSGTSDNTFTVSVSAKQGISNASVNPSPVKLRKGKDVKVTVKATASNAQTVTARLVSDDSGQYYDLGVLEAGSDGSYSGVTYLADDSTPGTWTLEVNATRGGQTLKGVAAFTVEAPTGGVSKKAKSRVTINAPAKVTKGRVFKVIGKATRGSKGYRTTVEIYFKVKGSKKYKL
ncbi:MAG: hypothetical protein HOY71_25930, partial [Nonomuraea sp.]|nr:hypothetical protein [Nonomuraea sp.]